ncbi:WD40 repeat domain-containing protein [Singulisphaera sp. Ch08]|uniref:WD40 repeat domain-containing protein n=1 Tax=Singulisphaera sp. Ch08 TaxID=3120278 RepID=A0AAU7CRE3_9BACT
MLRFSLAQMCEDQESSTYLKGEPAAQLSKESHGTRICKLAFSPEGSRLAVSTIAGGLGLTNLATGKSQTLQEGPVGSVRQLVFSPIGSSLAFVGKDALVRSWNWETGVLSGSSELDTEAFRSLAISRDGRLIAVGTFCGRIVIWDQIDAQPLTWFGQLRPVNNVAFSPNGRVLAAADSLGALTMWDLASGQTLASVQTPLAAVVAMEFSPDGSRISTLSYQERIVRVWDAKSGAFLCSLPTVAVPCEINAIAYSPNGLMVAVARADGVAELLDATSGRVISSVRKGRSLTAVAFSPDGTQLATGDSEGMARLWDLNKWLGVNVARTTLQPLGEPQARFVGEISSPRRTQGVSTGLGTQ